jgi:hypothetical protein
LFWFLPCESINFQIEFCHSMRRRTFPEVCCTFGCKYTLFCFISEIYEFFCRNDFYAVNNSIEFDNVCLFLFVLFCLFRSHGSKDIFFQY